MLSGKRILLGVTGGIAAYKAVVLLREFQKKGADVRVTMTPAATRFVGTETFSALSRHRVAIDVFNKNDDTTGNTWTQHIHWGEWADLFVIAPCTANTLSKIVHGQADNMLTSTVLAARCPVLLCPTMDGEMYASAAVSNNLKAAEQMGFYLMEPGTGYLASGLQSVGRLPESDDILAVSADIIAKHTIQGPLTGKKVVVTAGPTREFLDPVRFLSNPSSGKMGIAMAEAARRLGGEVTLLHGPVSVPLPDRIHSVPFTSADDLFGLIRTHADADVVIMAAAVADFKPVRQHSRKIKKEKAESSVALERNPDILAWLGEKKREGQILIGFAMETEDLEKNALSKLSQKNLDWICANSLSEDDSGFESDTNTIHLFGKNQESRVFTGPKNQIAQTLLSDLFSGEN